MVQLVDLSEQDSIRLIRSQVEKISPGAANDLLNLVKDNRIALYWAALLVSKDKINPRAIIAFIQDTFFSNFDHKGIVGVDGKPLRSDSPERSQIITDVRILNTDILNQVRHRPETLRGLPPRKFEELVAELLSRLDYEVTLTPASKDGGFDMFAAKKDGLG